MSAGQYSYVPKRGDLVYIDFDPQSGHEQAKRRPALVLSTVNFSRATNLVLVCPVTSTIRGNNFQVALPPNLKVTGMIMTEQIKSFDWKARNIAYICRCPTVQLNEALAKVQSHFQ